MNAEIGKLSGKKFNHLFRVAACLDGLENGSHVSVTETERARLSKEGVANIEQWRGEADAAAEQLRKSRTQPARAGSLPLRIAYFTADIPWAAAQWPTRPAT
jgi:hypothetical protein